MAGAGAGGTLGGGGGPFGSCLRSRRCSCSRSRCLRGKEADWGDERAEEETSFEEGFSTPRFAAFANVTGEEELFGRVTDMAGEATEDAAADTAVDVGGRCRLVVGEDVPPSVKYGV